MKSGVQVGFMEVPEDIAARKKAEEEAARKKAKYAQLIGPFNAFPAKLQKDCATVMGKLLTRKVRTQGKRVRTFSYISVTTGMIIGFLLVFL